MKESEKIKLLFQLKNYRHSCDEIWNISLKLLNKLLSDMSNNPELRGEYLSLAYDLNLAQNNYVDSLANDYTKAVNLLGDVEVDNG